MKELIELKIYLMKNGITQTKLSESTGLHKNTISKLLNSAIEVLHKIVFVHRDKAYSAYLNLQHWYPVLHQCLFT